ncbi:PREDICTED: uncharacterized protein LOC106808432 [Priapulus caudatus]|uniref:Uncharacterized protein LOC106808432 n=1 Tax=Priapulus caudatus TaxID=37621 RepID=A0ABM1E373_PRICU|nr:PREDICTED: uncharacterized protein LOC106808432 [Priapulus caudatus]
MAPCVGCGEGECVFRKDALTDICELITGDAELHTMFRVDGERVACPLEGPFRFSYDNGFGACADPMSHIDKCADDSKLKLSYQACADIHQSEHKSEQLECLATWQEGSRNYLVGRRSSRNILTDEESFRCFMYRSTEKGFAVAQSADAKCRGLESSSYSLELQTRSYPPAACFLPSWMTAFGEWQTLDGRHGYQLNENRLSGFRKLIVRNGRVLHADSCLEIRNETNAGAILLSFTLEGCRNGYMCHKIYNRAHQILEIESGLLTADKADACDESSFTNSHLETLLPVSSLADSECPHRGRYALSSMRDEVNCEDAESTLDFGCLDGHTITIKQACDSKRPDRSLSNPLIQGS